MEMVVAGNHQPVPQKVPTPPPLPQAYKDHFIKVCEEGFVRGRALGEDIPVHGVANDSLLSAHVGNDAGQGGDGMEDSWEAASPSATCGKDEFTLSKSLLDHGRTSNYEEGDDFNDGTEDSVRRSTPLHDADGDGEEVEGRPALAGGWSKGKRTRRANKAMMVISNGQSVTEATSPSSEEEDLANCLVMLSSSRPPVVVLADADHQESSPPASKDDVQPISTMAAPAMPELKLLPPLPPLKVVVVQQPAVSAVPRGLFECKACKKAFTSHQALGGHRASHKKVKGCFAAPSQHVKAATDIISRNANAAGLTAAARLVTTEAPETRADVAPFAASSSPTNKNKKKGKLHECSVCHRVFTSGQALGGHKRCHWLTTGGSGDSATTGTVAKLHHHPPIVAQDHVVHAMCQQLTLGRPVFDAAAHATILDLNTPANTTKQQAADLEDGGVLCLNAPASLYMQSSWTSLYSNANKTSGGRNDAEDEAESRTAKRGKISDLRDMDVAGETSPWLQVGIGLPSPSETDKSIQE